MSGKKKKSGEERREENTEAETRQDETIYEKRRKRERERETDSQRKREGEQGKGSTVDAAGCSDRTSQGAPHWASEGRREEGVSTSPWEGVMNILLRKVLGKGGVGKQICFERGLGRKVIGKGTC